MTSILSLAVGFPIGAGISYLLEEHQQYLPCFLNNHHFCFGLPQRLLRHDDISISSFLRQRIHAYTFLTWSGFAVFIYLLWTRSDGMAFVDPHAAGATHSLLEGLLMGGVSGILLGCGLMGSILNYQQIRVGDTEIRNSDLTIQLITNDEEEST